MTTYNTGNPIGSKDPRDLYDNAENLDEAVNTRTAESWDDRFGVPRKTWWGMEQDFQQFLLDSGYQNIGDYGQGLEITARNQIFWRDGELYRAGAALELPYTTTGDWSSEEGLFVAVGDAALRQQLSGTGPDSGAFMINRAAVTIDSISELRGLPPDARRSDLMYMTRGYHAGSTVGGAMYRFDLDSTEPDDGGRVIAPSDGSGRWIMQGTGPIYLEQFGLRNDITDVTQILASAIRAGSAMRCPVRITQSRDDLEIDAIGDLEGIEFFDLDLNGSRIHVKYTEESPSWGLRISNIQNVLETSLSVSPTVGNNYADLTVADGIRTGDILFLRSDEVWNPARPDSFFTTNYFRVTQVSGSRVYFDMPVYDSFDISTYTVRVQVIRPIVAPKMAGVSFLDTREIVVDGTGAFLFFGTIDSRIWGCEAIGFSNQGLVIGNSLGGQIIGGYVEGIQGTNRTVGYGAYLFNTRAGQVIGVRGSNNWHTVEFGGAAEDCQALFCHAVRDIRASFVSHGLTRRITLYKCTSMASHSGAALRGISSQLLNCHLESTDGNCFVLGETPPVGRFGIGASNALVQGNTFIHFGATAILQIPITCRDTQIVNNSFRRDVKGGYAILINGDGCTGVDIAWNIVHGASIYVAPQLSDDVSLALVNNRVYRSPLHAIHVVTGSGAQAKLRLQNNLCANSGQRGAVTAGTYRSLITGGNEYADNDTLAPSYADATYRLESDDLSYRD